MLELRSTLHWIAVHGPPIISTVKDIVTVLATGFGAWIAWSGLSTWKRQLRGNTQYELARRLLRSVYRVRDELQNCRRPMITSSEQATAIKEAGQGDDNSNIDSDAAVYSRRWSFVAKALSDLELEKTEAEVIWGTEIIQELKPLDACASTLYFRINEYLRSKTRSGPLDDRAIARANEIDRVIYCIGDENSDSFTAEIKQAVVRAEGFVKPHLKV